jgi:hypothetical protein
MGIEIEEMALLMSIPEVREATDAEKIDDINIRRLSSLMKKSDDVFLGGMLKDEKVSGSVVLVLWVAKQEIEEYMIDNKVEMKSDEEVKSLFASQFTDGHRLRMVLRNLASGNTLPLAHLYLRQVLSKYDDWNLDAIFKRYHDLVESKTDSQLLNYLK